VKRVLTNQYQRRFLLLTYTQGYEFTVPSINIDVKTATKGLEVQFEYWDQHDNRFLSGGKLVWAASSGQKLWDHED